MWDAIRSLELQNQNVLLSPKLEKWYSSLKSVSELEEAVKALVITSSLSF